MSAYPYFLSKLNQNDKKIFGVIFWHQRINPKGIRSNELRRQTPIRGSMNKNAFLRHLKKLENENIIIKDEIISEGGQNQVYYQINQDHFEIMVAEYEARIYDTSINEAKLFLDDIQEYKSDEYSVAILEFLLGRVILTAINSLIQEDEIKRGAIYFDLWVKIYKLLDGIKIKSMKNKKDKREIYYALLDLLKPYSERSIGKQLMLDEIYEKLKHVKYD